MPIEIVKTWGGEMIDAAGGGYWNARHPDATSAGAFAQDGTTDDTAKWGAVSSTRSFLLTGVSKTASDVGVTCRSVRFAPGAMIKPASGKIFYVDFIIDAQPGQQIFDESLGGQVWVVRPHNGVHPEWWGAASVDLNSTPSIDASAAFAAAARTASYGGPIKMGNRAYLVQDLGIPANGLQWDGGHRLGARLYVPSGKAAFKPGNVTRAHCKFSNFTVVGETSGQGRFFDWDGGAILAGTQFENLLLSELEYSFYHAEGGLFSSELNFLQYENAPEYHADPGQVNAVTWTVPRFSGCRDDAAAFELTAANGNNVNSAMVCPIFEGNLGQIMKLRDQLGFRVIGTLYAESNNLSELALPHVDVLVPAAYTTTDYEILTVDYAFVTGAWDDPQVFIGSSEGNIYAIVSAKGVITPGNTLIDTGTILNANLLNRNGAGIAGSGPIVMKAGQYIAGEGALLVTAEAASNFSLGNGGDTGRLTINRIERTPYMPVYADNAAALTGGLSTGDEYVTATGERRRVT